MKRATKSSHREHGGTAPAGLRDKIDSPARFCPARNTGTSSPRRAGKGHASAVVPIFRPRSFAVPSHHGGPRFHSTPIQPATISGSDWRHSRSIWRCIPRLWRHSAARSVPFAGSCIALSGGTSNRRAASGQVPFRPLLKSNPPNCPFAPAGSPASGRESNSAPSQNKRN